METTDLLQILIPSLISLIGFPLTYFFTKRQIKSEHGMTISSLQLMSFLKKKIMRAPA